MCVKRLKKSWREKYYEKVFITYDQAEIVSNASLLTHDLSDALLKAMDFILLFS